MKTLALIVILLVSTSCLGEGTNNTNAAAVQIPQEQISLRSLIKGRDSLRKTVLGFDRQIAEVQGAITQKNRARMNASAENQRLRALQIQRARFHEMEEKNAFYIGELIRQHPYLAKLSPQEKVGAKAPKVKTP